MESFKYSASKNRGKPSLRFSPAFDAEDKPNKEESQVLRTVPTSSYLVLGSRIGHR